VVTIEAKPTVEACPKCGATLKAGAEACATCGLAAARMATFKSERDTAVSEVARAAWDAVLESWTDEARHEALFRLIAERGEYGWAAGRYRDEAKQRPGDAIAAKQMERIRRAIEATLAVSATAREKPGASPYKGVMAMMGVLVVVVIVGLFYVFIKSHTGGDDPPPPPPRPMSPAPRVR